MKAIKNRADIFLLVSTFYNEIRNDDLIGPVFNRVIPTEKWPDHLEKLTDFWETNLFGISKFKGNPVQAHREVDKAHNYSIDQEHFGRWLNIWFSTIDSLYNCDKSQRAKDSARAMATGQYVAMWQAKPCNM
ncbi:MAG: globin [Flavobacteriales bacterium]|nr:MAG: globin [Flavobacteriales bacterium]